MENDVEEVENRHAIGSTIVSKVADPATIIDSICMDVNHTYEDMEQCRPFSIREYVSKVREKDWKICWPFGLGDNDDILEDTRKSFLPPMDLPRFRSSRGQNSSEENHELSAVCRNIGSEAELIYNDLLPMANADLSEGAEAMAKNDDQCGLHRREAQEVHLSVDLTGENKDLNGKKKTRKRKLSTDDEWTVPLISFMRRKNKKIPTSRRDAETVDAVRCSEPDKDAVYGVGKLLATGPFKADKAFLQRTKEQAPGSSSSAPSNSPLGSDIAPNSPAEFANMEMLPHSARNEKSTSTAQNPILDLNTTPLGSHNDGLNSQARGKTQTGCPLLKDSSSALNENPAAPSDVSLNDIISAKKLIRIKEKGIQRRPQPRAFRTKPSRLRFESSAPSTEQFLRLVEGGAPSGPASNNEGLPQPGSGPSGPQLNVSVEPPKIIPGESACAEVGANGDSNTTCPPKRTPETETCGVSRNPAEFTTPEPGNEYLLEPEQLKSVATSSTGKRRKKRSADRSVRRKVQ